MRARTAAVLFAASAISVILASCADLRALAVGSCGNLVVDAQEDCDSRAEEPGTKCAGPSDEHACRYVCGPEGGDCPKGWGCGADGVCREGSGSYAPLGDLIPFGLPRAAHVGDFDGDGFPDILLLGQPDAIGRMSARIVYPATPSAPAAVVPIPKAVAAVAIGDMGSDGFSDVLFGALGGVSLLRGRRNRSLDFIAFPSLLLPADTSLRAVPLEVLPDAPGDEIVTLIDRKDEGVTLERPPGVLPGAVLTDLPGGEEDLAGEIAWGRLDEGSPCEEIVLPYVGAGEVLIFSPCRVTGGLVEWNVGGAPRAVSLPAGVAIDRGALIADLDLDGHLDLLIGAGGRAYVAWGIGDGTFSSAHGSGTPDTAAPYAMPAAAGGDMAFPLAVADVNGDGTIDFVVPSGVALSSPAGHTRAHTNLGMPWTRAVIADFNDNGRLDIAAASSEAIDIDFLNNVGGDVLNAATLPTDGPVERLAVGDFDGDLITDLAFSQALDRGGEALDFLTVAFGASHGPPTDVTLMGAVGELEQIAIAHVAEGSAIDGIGDLVVVAQARATSTDALYTFRGSASRFLGAPLPLGTAAGPALPIALAAGRFGDSTQDAAAVSADGITGELRIFRVDGDEDLTLSDLIPSSPLPSGFHPIDRDHVNFRYGLFAAAADLQNDGVDEIVIVAPYGDTDAGSALLVADYDDASSAFVPRTAQPFTGRITEDTLLRVVDVDGDDHPDALVSTGGDLWIFWNDGKGRLEVASPQRIEVDGGVAGFDCVPARSGCDLVIVSPTKASIAKRSGRAFTVSTVPDLPGGQSVAAADFDRDGTTDVVILVAGGLQIHRAVPVLP